MLRDATWMNAGRARAWCSMLLAGQVAMAGYLLSGDFPLDPAGRPVGTDFASFWTAARFAFEGHAAEAWSQAAHHAAQRTAFGPDTEWYAFFYPPPFLLLLLPLGLLPYALALPAWLGLSFAGWWRVTRALLPEGWAVLPILAFPAVWVTVTHGQNAFLTAALFTAAALLLERRAVPAGLCIAGLAIKPHLAIVVPLAWVAAGRWRAIAAAAAGAVGFAAVSALALGWDAWEAFLALSRMARATLEDGLVGHEKMASVFAAVRLLGGGAALAWGVQGVVALGVLAVLLPRLRRRPGGIAEMATTAAATPLVSPFLLDYDLLLLGLPLAFVLRAALREGWLPWERIVLLAGFVLPFVARPLATWPGVPVAPLVCAALLWVAVRRLDQRSR
ncbi:glycosyltransferase family 87 protein [Falsiroseomonas sp. HW251]|uniref:glycosyltransferase family 87 protein n=1 Tax=Falsiroseomonas sp. HW251 TaxID=3390998 RepID=UPI003D31F311